ncbi:MAG: hypothetical protein WCX65_06705 [bacterium]
MKKDIRDKIATDEKAILAQSFYSAVSNKEKAVKASDKKHRGNRLTPEIISAQEEERRCYEEYQTFLRKTHYTPEMAAKILRISKDRLRYLSENVSKFWVGWIHGKRYYDEVQLNFLLNVIEERKKSHVNWETAIKRTMDKAYNISPVYYSALDELNRLRNKKEQGGEIDEDKLKQLDTQTDNMLSDINKKTFEAGVYLNPNGYLPDLFKDRLNEDILDTIDRAIYLLKRNKFTDNEIQKVTKISRVTITKRKNYIKKLGLSFK